jgi:hypothetical protein
MGAVQRRRTEDKSSRRSDQVGEPATTWRDGPADSSRKPPSCPAGSHCRCQHDKNGSDAEFAEERFDQAGSDANSRADGPADSSRKPPSCPAGSHCRCQHDKNGSDAEFAEERFDQANSRADGETRTSPPYTERQIRSWSDQLRRTAAARYFGHKANGGADTPELVKLYL